MAIILALHHGVVHVLPTLMFIRRHNTLVVLGAHDQ